MEQKIKKNLLTNKGKNITVKVFAVSQIDIDFLQRQIEIYRVTYKKEPSYLIMSKDTSGAFYKTRYLMDKNFNPYTADAFCGIPIAEIEEDVSPLRFGEIDIL